jgi:hypothetical protein
MLGSAAGRATSGFAPTLESQYGEDETGAGHDEQPEDWLPGGTSSPFRRITWSAFARR